MDWYSRRVLSWKLSNTMDVDFCVQALDQALSQGKPEVFNTDQGSQFTSEVFTGLLLEQGIQVSMDGKGRYLDNIFVERLLAESKVRGGVSEGLPEWDGSHKWNRRLSGLLQPRTSASSFGLSYARSGVR